MVTADAGEARKQGRAGAATFHKQEERMSTPSSTCISPEHGQEAKEADSGEGVPGRLPGGRVPFTKA